jgi:uncharacterized protein YndB with AHSA1/START domain
MSTTTETGTTTQRHRVFIGATPEAIWEAITSPEATERYGYRGRAEYELRAGGSYRAHAPHEMKSMGAPDIVVDGEVVEADAPRRLVQTYRFCWDDEIKGEGFSRVTWEIEPDQTEGITRLTVTHEADDAPLTMATSAGDTEAGGGWSWILSDLKSYLETGRSLRD